MVTNIFKKDWKNQMELAFGCLIPEEAFKIMNCLFQEEFDEPLGNSGASVAMTYDLTGYRPCEENGYNKWARDLVVFVTMPDAVDGSMEDREQQLNDDKIFLEKLRDAVIRKTGLTDEEES